MAAREQTLPFFGFGQAKDYTTLSQHHPILFRLHTFNASPSLLLDVVAPKYSDIPEDQLDHTVGTYVATSTDLATHLRTSRAMVEWGSGGHKSPWLSATFSFAWVLWEAQRRLAYKSRTGSNMYVIVIDGRHASLEGRAETAVMALEHLGEYSQEDYNFADACQEVLVHGHIDNRAILGICPWSTVEKLVPPECLGGVEWPTTDLSRSTAPFRDYAWNLATTLYQHYNGSRRISMAVNNAVAFLSSRLAAQVHGSPERILDDVVETIRAIDEWIIRPGGPHTPLGTTIREQHKEYSAHSPGAVIRALVAHPQLETWEKRVRLALRMRDLCRLYNTYQETTDEQPEIERRTKQLRKALEDMERELE